MVRVLSFVIILLLSSCQRGYINDYGIYEPKRPNYKLNNKKEFIFPKHLDTVNIYVTTIKIDVASNKSKRDLELYIKFLKDGNCIKFGKFPEDTLSKKHFDPNNWGKCYYTYNTKKKSIKIESFVKATGNGRYLISDNFLGKEGEVILSTFVQGDTTYYRKKIIKKFN